MTKLNHSILFLAILTTQAYTYAQDLVFGIDPILLKGGKIELAAIGLYVKDKERLKLLIGAPRFKWGITSRWELNVTVPLVNVKRTLSPPSPFPLCDKGNEVVTKGVGDVITSIKWQPYRYVDRDEGEFRLLILLGGVAWPGNLPAAPLVAEDLVVTGTDLGCDKASFLLGASTLLIGAPWALLASFLLGVERENECGNRPGHFFSYSYGFGRKFGNQKFADIYGLLSFDWVFESSARRNFKKVPNSDRHILWFGPNLLIEQGNTREFKFGIQVPLAEINIKRDYRLFVAMEWE